jgi:glycosyltransferase involved in cell wall biosynthesis
MKITLGIDASRNRSGGAQTHLVGFISAISKTKSNFKEIHVWSYGALLKLVPDYPWLIKHYTSDLEKSLYRQLWWQATQLKKELINCKCDILFTTDASSFCRFSPAVVMSQDMLSYEPGVMKYFGYGIARLRLIVILFVQNFAFRHANGVIFLTKYAGDVIQSSCGHLDNVDYIPHGVSQTFKEISHYKVWPSNNTEPIRCLYVSPVLVFKHQWNVVKAIEKLRKKGYDISLDLIGGGTRKSLKKLKKQILLSDPNGLFINYHGPVEQNKLPNYIAQTDIYIFASSCENLPITLLEGMAVGAPIACSDRGPMPEVLKDGGVYFDPEDILSITTSINEIILDSELRNFLSERSKAISNEFSWENNSRQTLSFIEKTYLNQG